MLLISRARWRLVLLAALMLAPGGCYRHFTAAERARSMQSLEQAHWDRPAVGQVPVPVALLYAGCSVRIVEARPGGATVALAPTGPRVTVGIAVPIDSRGYLITAGHNIGREPLNVIYFDGQQLRAETPEVIAVYHTRELFDIAVLRVSRPIPQVCLWASDDEPQQGQALLAVGLDEFDRDRGVAPSGFTCIGGRLVGVRKAHGPQGAFGLLITDLPVRRGDSGGPLLTTQGKLLGINTRQQYVLLGPRRSIAMRPDLRWLREVIERAQSAVTEAPSREGSPG